MSQSRAEFEARGVDVEGSSSQLDPTLSPLPGHCFPVSILSEAWMEERVQFGALAVCRYCLTR